VLVSYQDYWWRVLAAPAQRAPLEILLEDTRRQRAKP
jgi:hypothetical protein